MLSALRRFRRKRPLDLPLHDRSVPLSPGAETILRADHPRLSELRAAYAALQLPVTEHSRWRSEHVESFLDLQYFRGETLIMWHYREDDEATQARYRALHDYVAARDHLGLLDRLTEDGAFGCWTFDIDGRRVSRDLLDAVNELSFLDRQLGVGQWTELRVLDIGAGYGRLAHRGTSAFPGCADWCCVDAVPEATFLAEYYLHFRRACPPARVVPLHEIGTLVPGSFDLALNVHAFSEMPLAAIAWWIEQVARLDVPRLLIVPNDGARLMSLERDGTRRPFDGLLAAHGYRATHVERAIEDRAVARIVGPDDRFCLFERGHAV